MNGVILDENLNNTNVEKENLYFHIVFLEQIKNLNNTKQVPITHWK